MPSFQVLVLGFADGFLSPFPDSLPQLFLRCLPLPFGFGLFRFPSASFRPLLFRLRLFSFPVLPFPSSCFRLSVASSVLRFFLSASLLSTFSSARFPVLLFRFLVLGFSAGFLSSFPVPLPQPLSWCLPSSGSLRPLLFGLFRSPSLSFVCSGSLLTTQLSASSFPFFPLSPGFGSFGVLRFLSSPTLSPSVTPVSMRSFRFRYSALCSSFLPLTFASQWLSRSRPHAFRFSGFPLAFALGSGYLACPFRTFWFASDLAYITTGTTFCQHLFFIFFNYCLAICNRLISAIVFVHPALHVKQHSNSRLHYKHRREFSLFREK